MSESQPPPIEILLVDDNDDDILLLQESLEGFPAVRVAQVVRDGEEALEYLRGEGSFTGRARPGLVLLDINMPRKNGFEVLEEMKADANLRGIPVVVLTTSNRETDVMRAYHGGACSFISKPANFDNLLSMAGQFVQYWSAVARIPKSA
jgi:CheY-like chemotaxis protein